MPLSSTHRTLGNQQARTSAPCLSASRLWGLVIRKERWGLSWRARMLLVAIIVMCGYGMIDNIYPFLAQDHRVNARVLVLEGWIDRYAIKVAVDEFNRGTYDWIFTTGGPVKGSGGYTNEYETLASVGAETVKGFGIPSKVVCAVPSQVIGKERTYTAAVALREWFRQNNFDVKSFNVLTEDTHARRTRLLFQQAFGPKTTIGVISVPDPDYDSKHWWRSSQGLRDVLSEGIAYIYAKFFFWPHAEKRTDITR